MKIIKLLSVFIFQIVNSLDIKADIHAVPFHKLVFSSSDPIGQDLISVKLLDKDLKCLIEPQIESKQEVQEQVSDNILELALQTVAQMSCLQWDLGFWKYEYCPNSGMSQFHQVPEKGVVLHYTLGSQVLNRELGTVNDTHSFAFASITLGKGTVCDVTGEPRSIEIQFHCKENINDHISKVSEVATCRYLAVIYTSKICNISSRFIPQTVVKERLITCYGAQKDGGIKAFFSSHEYQALEENVEQEDDEAQDDLMAIAKKLLKQNGYSLEIMQLDQDL